MYLSCSSNNDQWMGNSVSYIPHPLSPMFSDYLKQIPEVLAFGGCGIFSCIQNKILNPSHGLSRSDSHWLLQPQITVTFSVSPEPGQPVLSQFLLLSLLTSWGLQAWLFPVSRKPFLYPLPPSLLRFSCSCFCYHHAHHCPRGPNRQLFRALCFSTNSTAWFCKQSHNVVSPVKNKLCGHKTVSYSLMRHPAHSSIPSL